MNRAKHRIAIASKAVTGQYGSSPVLQQVSVGGRYMHHLLIQQWARTNNPKVNPSKYAEMVFRDNS